MPTSTRRRREGKAFVAAYHAKMGFDPSYQSAEAYDIIALFAYSIKKGGSYAGPAIRDALASAKGVPSMLGGTISMGADHYTYGEAAALWQARGAGEVEISTAK